MVIIAAFVTTLIIYRIQQEILINDSEIIILFVTGFLFLITFVSGALLSFDKLANNFLLLIHKILPVLTLVSLIITVCIMKIAVTR